MTKKSLRHTLASLSIAGLIAGVGVAMPGSSFGSSGCGGPSGCGGASGCGGSQKGMTGCGGASSNPPPSTIPMDEMKEEMTPPPELPGDQQTTGSDAQTPAEHGTVPDSGKK